MNYINCTCCIFPFSEKGLIITYNRNYKKFKVSKEKKENPKLTNWIPTCLKKVKGK